MRVHRRALALGVLALAVGAGIAAGVVAIARARRADEHTTPRPHLGSIPASAPWALQLPGGAPAGQIKSWPGV